MCINETNYKEPYLEQIRERQKCDDTIAHIRSQLADGTGKGAEIEAGEFDNIKNNLLLHRGIVFVRDKDKDLVLIPTKDHLEFVINTHNVNVKLVGHVGMDKLRERIEHVAYVPHLPSFLHYVKETCSRCAQVKDESRANAIYPIQDMPVPDIRGERWHIDLHGPIGQGKDQFYLIGAVEALTKYMVADVVQTKSAVSATQFILDHIIYTLGYHLLSQQIRVENLMILLVTNCLKLLTYVVFVLLPTIHAVMVR